MIKLLERKPYVYLIGAGPGDPGLLTLKGLACIKKSDVIIYDRLANTKLLEYAPEGAELIFVGKSPDKHTFTQEEINKLIVQKALEGKVVTRLKGGDPFVFGRGGEEALELVKNKLPFEIVPGITSAIAVPAYAGIPVTHRGVTSSVTFLTGNEDPAKEDSDIDWSFISKGVGTLVFLMGMSNLPKIADKLIEYGRHPSTPVALIRWGTLYKQQTLISTLEHVSDDASNCKFKNPAVIVVGEVVNLRKELQWFENRPLWGKRIIVTRSRGQASLFSQIIEEFGGQAVEFPTIELAPADDYEPLDIAIRNLGQYHWVIFTSINGVQAFLKRLKFQQKDLRELKGINICAIGPKTKESLENYGLIVDYVPDEYRAEAIIEFMSQQKMSGKRILLPRADIARKILPEALKQYGAIVDEIIAYKTVKANHNSENVRTMLKEGMIDYITFTSSSTVKNFVGVFNPVELPVLLKHAKIASIGPVTTDTAHKLGLKVDIEAKEYTLHGLLQAILEHNEKGHIFYKI